MTRPTYSKHVTKETTSPSPFIEEDQVWKVPRVVSRAKHARFNDFSYLNGSIQTLNRYASLQDCTVGVESPEQKNDTSEKRIVRPWEDDYATVVKSKSQWSNDVMQGTKNMISINGNKEYGNQSFPSRTVDMEKADSSFTGQFEETNNINTTTKSSNVADDQWGDSVESSVWNPLSCIFERCLETGIYPSQWKKANIIPAHKKDCKQNKKNYRPISLLPIFGKLFEKL